MPGFADDPDAEPEPEDEGGDELPSPHDCDGEDADIGDARSLSLEDLRDHALRRFGTTMQRQSGKDFPLPPPEESHGYLPLEELDAIVREHGCRAEDGMVVGGETRGEAVERFGTMMSAILSRILSNVLRSAVQHGMIDCEFDPEANDFMFSVTDEARKRSLTGDEEEPSGP
jgi:hypothetical protein